MNTSTGFTSAKRLDAILKVVISTIFGLLVYGVWLSIELVSADLGQEMPQALTILLPPLAVAAGFALGCWTYEILIQADQRTGFIPLFLFALAVCAAGAALTYAFGPVAYILAVFAAPLLAFSTRAYLRYSKSGPH